MCDKYDNHAYLEELENQVRLLAHYQYLKRLYYFAHLNYSEQSY